jgi:hypothetical protein
VDEFKKAYPEVQLRDKLFLRAEGNVVDSFVGKVIVEDVKCRASRNRLRKVQIGIKLSC